MITLILTASLLAQQEAKLVFAERYEEAFAEAKIRNVPVVIMDFDFWSPNSPEEAFRDFEANKQFLRAVEGAVLIPSSAQNHGEKQQLVDGEVRTVCGMFGSVRPDRPSLNKNMVFRDFAENGVLKTPVMIVCNPEKEVFQRCPDESSPMDTVSALKRAARRMGAGMPRSDFRRMKAAVARVKRGVEFKEYARAIESARSVADVPGDFPPHQELAALLSKLDESGVAKLTAASEQWTAGEHLAALCAWDQVATVFESRPCADQAEAELGGALKSPEGKAVATAFKNWRKARALYDEGMKYYRADEAKKALKVLRQLVKKYPDSDFAADALDVIPSVEREVEDAKKKKKKRRR